jgi:hypothetical protein
MKLNEIATIQQLIQHIAPSLDQMAADANLFGSVQIRIAPLVAALPPKVALTAAGVESLKLTDTEEAYLLYETLRRLFPKAMHAAVVSNNSFGAILEAALQRAGTTFSPFWLQGERAFVTGEHELAKVLDSALTVRQGVPPTLRTVRGFSKPLFRAITSNQVVIDAPARVVGANGEIAECATTYMTLNNSNNTWFIAFNGVNHRLDELPTRHLQALRGLLGEFTATSSAFLNKLRVDAINDDTDVKTLATVAQTIDGMVEKRYETDTASVERAFVAFERGDLQSLVGAVPQAEINKVAGNAAT